MNVKGIIIALLLGLFLFALVYTFAYFDVPGYVGMSILALIYAIGLVIISKRKR